MSTGRHDDSSELEEINGPDTKTHLLRKRLPDTRRSITHKFTVAGHEGYLTVGLYEDGSPGELFIPMAKEGSTIGGLMNCFGTAVSVCLQHGVPLNTLVQKFAHTRFEPSGFTKDPDIPMAKSLMDYLFRWLGKTFCDTDGENEHTAATQTHMAGATTAVSVDSSAPPRTVRRDPEKWTNNLHISWKMPPRVSNVAPLSYVTAPVTVASTAGIPWAARRHVNHCLI